MPAIAKGRDDAAYKAGSECPPPPSKDVLRLYCMRFCPFADRAVIALQAKEIPHEVININLQSKPEWYLAKNPLGKVPTVEYNGKIVYDSSIVVEYVDAIFEGKMKLIPSDPYERAKHRMLLEHLGGTIGALYPFLARGDKSCFPNVEKECQKAEDLLEGDYYGGSQPGFFDYIYWSFLVRVQLCVAASEGEFKLDKFPKLSAYINRMLARPEIAASTRSMEEHVAYWKTQVAGNPDYDVGIAK